MPGRSALREAARMVFFGTLIVVLDFEINGFDLINDVVGAGLVVAGVVKVSNAGLGGRFALPAVLVSAVWFVTTIVETFVLLPALLAGAAGLILLAAAILDLLLFRHACRQLALDEAASSWSTSLALATWIWGGLTLLGIGLALLHGGAFSYEGPVAIPVVIAAFAPVVHILVTLRRTVAATDAPSPTDLDEAAPAGPTAQ